MTSFGTFLLEVEDTFDLERVGLVVLPQLPLPDRFESQRLDVELLKPDGTSVVLNAELTAPHFRYESGKSESVLQIGFPEHSKGDVPIGSKIMIDKAAARVVAGDA